MARSPEVPPWQGVELLSRQVLRRIRHGPAGCSRYTVTDSPWPEYVPTSTPLIWTSSEPAVVDGDTTMMSLPVVPPTNRDC